MHVFRNLSAADSSHRGKQPERMVQLLLKEHTAAGDGGDDAAESFWALHTPLEELPLGTDVEKYVLHHTISGEYASIKYDD